MQADPQLIQDTGDVGSHDIAALIAALTAELIRTDRTSGARRAAPQALRAVSIARRKAQGSHTLSCGALAALAELFQVAAWILFDAERHGLSRALSHQALNLSRRLPEDQRSIELLILSVLCLQQEHLGFPGSSLHISSSVLTRKDLPERVAAIFHVREARAHAQLQQQKKALWSLNAAEELLTEEPSERDPSWTWWFDRTEFTGHQGLAHAALGNLKTAASHLYEAAAPGGAPAYRSLFSTELGAALARAGAWREADAWLSTLVDTVPRIGSVRSLNSLTGTTHIIKQGRSVPRTLRNTNRHLTELLQHQKARAHAGSRESRAGSS